MSFGCSVGDIVLLSQLSFKIYKTLTSGRKSASKDLVELGDVLFGFGCALDHLRNVADDISKKDLASKAGRTHEVDMRHRLDQMVRNCATTLEDLESATRKYREGAQLGEPDTVAIQDDSEANRRTRLKQRLSSNIMKIRWDIDKDTLRTYRLKLQSHTDAINIVLSTFVWSTTHSIRADNQINSEKLSNIQETMASSNSELRRLMQDMLALMNSNEAMKSKISVSAHFAAGEMGSGTILSQKVVQSAKVESKPSCLPYHIQSLNAKRRAFVPQTAVGMLKPGEQHLGSHSTQPKVAEPPRVTELIQELDLVFQKGSYSRTSPAYYEEVYNWVRRLDLLLHTRLLEKSRMPKDQNQDLVMIPIHLNELVDHADDSTLDMFYKCSRQADIDSALGKIPTAATSVRARKEVEDFGDTRDEWEEEHC